MCFSATASFSAAGFLTCAGLYALSAAKTKSYYLLAFIPLLFALQQASEGIIWLTHTHPEHAYCLNVSSRVFLIFAFLVWPIWIPIALFFPEKQKKRQCFIGALIVLGIALSAFGGYQFSAYQDSMTIISNHVQYATGFSGKISPNIYLLTYACATILPFFISSLRWSKLSGIVLLGSLIFTDIIMTNVFISVWCFFAAVLSGFMVLMVKNN
ncbi:MAG: hypothetical protein Q8L78_09315 [Coxiellaceae bacterium]|nr:hypothetical protein [Coxiellaceae bacterium]